MRKSPRVLHQRPQEKKSNPWLLVWIFAFAFSRFLSAGSCEPETHNSVPQSIRTTQTTNSQTSVSPFAQAIPSAHFRIYSNGQFPYDLNVTAEQARSEFGAWFGFSSGRLELLRSVPVFLCQTTQELEWVERYYGETYYFNRANPNFRHDGGFYPRSMMISIRVNPVDSEETVKWQICHEVSHLMFYELTGCSNPAIDEGIAEVFSGRFLKSQLAELRYRDRCARVAKNNVSVMKLLSMSWKEFHETQDEELHYALSWSLAKLLLESQDPHVASKLPALLEAMRRGGCDARLVETVYDVESLDLLWRKSLKAMAK